MDISKYLKLIIGLSLAAFCLLSRAHAVEIDTGANDPFYKVEGKKSTVVEAILADHEKKLVEKCTPVKQAVDSEGKSTTVFKCGLVKRVISAKTGNETWKKR